MVEYAHVDPVVYGGSGYSSGIEVGESGQGAQSSGSDRAMNFAVGVGVGAALSQVAVIGLSNPLTAPIGAVVGIVWAAWSVSNLNGLYQKAVNGRNVETGASLTVNAFNDWRISYEDGVGAAHYASAAGSPYAYTTAFGQPYQDFQTDGSVGVDPATIGTAVVGEVHTAAAPATLEANAMEPVAKNAGTPPTAAESGQEAVLALTGRQLGALGLGAVGLGGALLVGGAVAPLASANATRIVLAARNTQGLAASRVLEQNGEEQVTGDSGEDGYAAVDGAVDQGSTEREIDAAVALEQKLDEKDFPVAVREGHQLSITYSGSSETDTVATAFAAEVTARADAVVVEEVKADGPGAGGFDASHAANEIKPFARRRGDGVPGVATVPAPAFAPTTV